MFVRDMTKIIKNKIEENKDTMCQYQDLQIKHKENLIEVITNALMAMIITVFISICTCVNIPFVEFMAILSTLEISELVYLVVGCVKENKKYKKEKEILNQLNEENITLNNQLSKEEIILRSLSKHKEDDSKLNMKKIDLDDSKRYLNSLINNEETVKIKQKSRFKK